MHHYFLRIMQSFAQIKLGELNGFYILEYNLRPGEYQYKFVINGEHWFYDPENRVYLNKLSQDKVQIKLGTRKNDVEVVSLMTKINSERAQKEMSHYIFI